MTVDQREQDLLLALGRAASKIWSNLPQDVQHELFEEAVSFLAHVAERHGFDRLIETGAMFRQ